LSELEAARIAARIDRLPRSHVVWRFVLLASAGGVFEFYNLFLTGYIAPWMIRAGMFLPASIGFFARLRDIAVSGVGTFVFCTFAGLWVGVVLFSQCADFFGRRSVFTWSLVWYVACTIIMAFQRTGEALNIWRFIAGIGFGVQLVTMDTYIAEMIPAAERGRAFAVNQAVTFSIVPVAALAAWLVSPYRPWGLDGWRWVFLAEALGLAVIWRLRAGLPESPRWLAMRGRAAEAEAVMARIEAEVEAAHGAPLPAPAPATPEEHAQGHFWELFSPRYIERTIMLSIFNMAQVIGFYGFAAWVPTLLIARGVTLTHSLEYSFIIAIANPFGPALATLFADRIERKFQIILGLVLMGAFMACFSMARAPGPLILLGVLFTLSANLMSYAFHAYQAELYPTRIRARGIGFVYSWSRSAAAFAGLAIGYFLHAGGVPAVAVFIGVAMVVAIVIIGVFGPHTGGRALEQINH
jgi:putative MFS transporter